MNPGSEAEATIAREIEAIIGQAPAHEPESARLPSGGVADFRVAGATLGFPGRGLLVEVKSMHDVTAQNRPWLLDYVLHHPDVPDHWPARSWSSAGEQRIKALGYEASNLTSREALRTFISIERLRGVADRGGQLFRLSAEVNQIATMILFGSDASLRPKLRWPAGAVGVPFPGIILTPLDPVAVAFFPGIGGRQGVGDDIRAGLARKFGGYSGADACLAIVVSDAETEDSWAALLDGAMGYPVDGSEPILEVSAPFEVSNVTLAVCASEPAPRSRWSYLAAGKMETVESFDGVCRAALDLAISPGPSQGPS